MDVAEQVEAHLAGQLEPRAADLRHLHALILTDFPGCRLWFSDGRNDVGKASVTGYCIRFTRVAVIDTEVLRAAIRDGMSAASQTC